MDRQTGNWKKISEKYIFNKGLISRKYREFLNINNKETTKLKFGEGSE